MGKKRQSDRELDTQDAKRVRISQAESNQVPEQAIDDSPGETTCIRVLQKDRIERKVDLIVKDSKNNCHHSLTIWGTGQGVEKTIAVVEELKRNYMKQGTQYHQKTSIKAGDNNEPHLQVVLTLLKANLDK